MNRTTFSNAPNHLPKGAKILFANFPGDGHFNPMTGLAAHLKTAGYDVRWYTSPLYRPKIEKLGIPFYPFVKAADINGDNVSERLPGREKYKSQIAKLNFDIVNVFVMRGAEYYEDVKAIHQTFPFEVMVADAAFTGIPFVTDIMKIPVAAVGVFPLMKTSKDLPPGGLGMTPSYTLLGRVKQGLLRFVAKNILFAKSTKAMEKEFGKYGIDTAKETVFDVIGTKCDLLLQTATPSFEYKRSDMEAKVKFVGALLPFTTKKEATPWYDERLSFYKKVVLVTQGTVEKDGSKLLVPALEALRGTDYLVVVTTGGSDTEKLRKQYTAPNVIIEDFIPFADIMPYADVYVTNGGMGGVMLGIQNGLPMVTAGVHEGKNEICARVGYFKLGVNLKTERPRPGQLRQAVDEVANSPFYRKNVTALCKEFARYNPNELCERYIRELLPVKPVTQQRKREAEAIY